MAVGGTQFAYPQTNNRLESSTGQQTAQYTHDDHGNITSDGTRTFIYNQDNRLAQVKDEDLAEEMGDLWQEMVGEEL